MSRDFRVHLFGLAALSAAVLLTVGCVTVRVGADGEIPTTRHHHSVPTGFVELERPLHVGLVSVGTLGAPQRYDLRIVEDRGDGTVRFLEYDRWAEAPADAISDLIREDLARSSAFGGVVEPGADVATSVAIEGYLLRCDVGRSDAGARLHVRLTLRLTDVRGPGELLDFGVYESEVDVGGEEALAYGPAVAAAVREILVEALRRWKPVLTDQ